MGNSPLLTKIWLLDGIEIRADFADDWHVRSDIYPPHDAESVAKALRFLAAMVEHHYARPPQPGDNDA